MAPGGQAYHKEKCEVCGAEFARQSQKSRICPKCWHIPEPFDPLRDPTDKPPPIGGEEE